MNRCERGSEVVQAVVAVPLVLLVVFAVVQMGGMMLSTHRLSADLVRACRQMDTAGLLLAGDKEAYLKSELLGPASQLQPERLRVEHVEFKLDQREGSENVPGTTEASPSGGRLSSIGQRTSIAKVSFDVVYEMPSLMAFPGLSGQAVSRHLACTRVEGRVVEVEVNEL
ncbi:pilus assembly protein [Gordonibacter sp.]|uniref:pilus assembly protein n=1 Tax=Gordonibacter sp. TaxID=1968902 RepID=UPI002FCB31A8